MKVLTPFSWTETEGVGDEGEGGVAVEGGTRGEEEAGLGEDSGRSGKRALDRMVEDEETVVGATGDGGSVSGEGVGTR